MDTHTSVIPGRIEQLRAVLKQNAWHGVLVLSSDPHLSEYLPRHWQSREHYSGFTGSMATLVVTRTQAALFADSRYWVQAEVELAGSGVELVKINSGASLQHIDWLADHLQMGDTLAVDGDVLSLAQAKKLETTLNARGIRVHSTVDPFRGVWQDRANLPVAKIYEHMPPHATVARRDKLNALRAAMQRLGVTDHFISTLDDIAWLFNLRGQDVEYNPVFLAHALVRLDGDTTLFVEGSKVPPTLRDALGADGIGIADYSQAKPHLGALSASARLLLDPRRVTLGFRDAVARGTEIVEDINPTTLMKSRKTAGDAAHIRQAMEQDGAALAEFFAWFETTIGRERITELTIDEKITAARANRPGFVCPSFSTIAGWKANGALPHYRATPASHAVIEGDGLLLIDSGGQYVNGTTDITRVVPVGQISDAERRDFTLVLKGMINLSRTVFPRGTLSPMLDALARAPIWAEGVDFGHGTGHGVGYFLNVHEGPQSISRTVPDANMAMEEGMVTSNEPGIYRQGKWGVRIENLVLNVAAQKNEFGDFLRFETLTLCPIDTRCIDFSIMRADELAWLNQYHATVFERVAPLVSGTARQWLTARTASV
jgi:Xaa-Pro aminopeptidase